MTIPEYVNDVASMFQRAVAHIDGIATDEINSIRFILANDELSEIRSLEVCLEFCIANKSWKGLSIFLSIIDIHRGG